MKSGFFAKVYPPKGPLTLLTIPLFFNEIKICSKKGKEISCLDDISDKLTGLFPTELIAISPMTLLQIFLLMLISFLKLYNSIIYP